MKKLFLSVFVCGAGFAQVQDIPGTEAIGVSRQKIVDNFNYLNSGKASATIGSVLPSNCPYNPAGPVVLFINNTGPTLNVCVATNTWAQLIGGGSSGPATWGQIVGALTDQADVVAALAQKSALVHGHAQSDITGLMAALATKEITASKGQPNGYAPLDASGKVPSNNLPTSSAVGWGAITGNIGDQADLGAALSGKEPANANIQQHVASTSNPHSTTKAQVGLGNVTNDAQLKMASNLGDLGNVPSARTNLGLGGAAILNVGTIAGTVAGGDHLHDARYSQISHGHAAGDVTSGLFVPARLGSGTADSTVVLYGDNVWRTPPGSSGGEANTGSNQGTLGVGVFKSKLGVDLGFYKLNPASARISIGINAGDHIDLDVVESQINHQNLSGAGTNTHTQIDTHLAATNNPHGTTCTQVGSPCTAGTYNDPSWLTGLAWSKLLSAPTTFAPSAHASSHGSGQSDAITIDAGQVGAGTFAAARLPNPGASSKGGVYSKAGQTHYFLTAISNTDGSVTSAQPACGDLSNASASCSTDTTNAANISSGTLPAARLPNPSASSKGGIYSVSCAANQHMSAISSADGSVTCSADTGGHAQNTDTGTTQSAFHIDSGNSGPKLKNNGGTLEVRNATDTAYLPVHASEFQSGDGTVAGALVMNEVAANGTAFRAWQAPDALGASLYMRFPDALPAAGDTLLFGTPAGGVSAMTFGKPAALASNGINCSTGQAALGVDAAGNAEGCWTPATAAISYVAGGTSDDTTAVAAAASTPGTYYFQPGVTYTVTGITVSANNVTWIGGAGAIIKHKAASTGNLLYVTGNNFRSNGLIYDANGIGSGSPVATVYSASNSGFLFENNTVKNSSATTLPAVPGLYFYQSSGTVRHNTFESTVLGYDIYNNANGTAAALTIEDNDLTGSKRGGIFTEWSGAGAQITIAKNKIRNVTAVDSGGGECGSNQGECGNGIVVFQSRGRTSIIGNHTYNTAFSGVRINASAHVTVTGNIIDNANETAIYSEFTSGSGGGAVITGNKVSGAVKGITNTNIGVSGASGVPAGVWSAGVTYGANAAVSVGDAYYIAAQGANTNHDPSTDDGTWWLGVNNPDIITGNSVYNARWSCYHIENATLTGNECHYAPFGVELGSMGGVGYGNIVSNNTFSQVGVAIAADKDLSATPNSQVGSNNVQVAQVPTRITPLSNAGGLAITAATKANPLVLTTSSTLPTAGKVYVLGGFYGMTEANGQLCTVASPSGSSFQCSGLNSTNWGTFAANPATNMVPGAQYVYSSGTTLAYSIPSVVVDKDATNADNIKSGTLAAARMAAQYKTFSCQPGLGDGLNAIPAGTYLESTCYNGTGVTVTITGIKCFSDNAGTSTLSVTNGAGTALLTGAVTCSASFAAGTQSATTTIANGDFLKFSFVADGTTKQTTWVVTETK